MVTIGVYGFDGESFLQRLRHADVRLLLDVRARRGVRGPEYTWATSRRLQAALAQARIAYEHHPELAPTTGLRRLQHAEDDRQGSASARRELAAETSEHPVRTWESDLAVVGAAVVADPISSFSCRAWSGTSRSRRSTERGRPSTRAGTRRAR
ncbi:hypothetical protein ALI22I_07405 [Saccharothrix sp. ALI-22-I]|uniref:DUF488 family protein n=1 Tax=Saccharothrix sp. ALI-22-I TaxID=1933778 RepID=UPI00097C8B32|nr:DUF488 family protein [Saccharothrix sp. ALI-22-I]ONI91695.1 hypothetical protein ALI22I_07405 [Saccharothrix sp. ALI-22-I]